MCRLIREREGVDIVENKFIDIVLDKVIETCEGKGLTGEKNLTISKKELVKRVENINPDYLEVMEKEANIFVRQGLFKGYFADGDILGDILFDIPDWDKFISAVDAFYKVCYTPESGEEE